MAVRKCPTCLTVVSAVQVVAYSDNLECPGCKSRLTVWDGSRLLAAFAGVLAGVVAWQLTSAGTEGAAGWTLPLLFSFLTFGVIAALFLMGTADLRIKPEEPTFAPLGAAGGDGAHGGVDAHH